jgi:hypothetical protein
VDLATWSFVVCFVSFLLWAFTGTYLSLTLRDHWPELHAMAGFPKPRDFWWRHTFPKAFDRFTLTRRFRSVRMDNPDLLLQFELVFLFRWVQIVSFGVFVISLLRSCHASVEP